VVILQPELLTEVVRE